MNIVRCRKCHRTLKDPESRARGYGPVCYRAAGGVSPARNKKTPRADTRISGGGSGSYNDKPGPLFLAQNATELERLINEGGDTEDDYTATK